MNPIPPDVPTTIDVNEVLQMHQIDEGGFAIVFRGVYRGMDVAVKKWRYQQLPPDQVELFRREVVCNRQCNHPNVVRFIGASMSPICIVTEFVSGRNMYEVIHDPAVQYTWNDFQKMALTAALGLQHIHQNNIMHRDLKSLNLLVEPNFNVKIIDFGLGRLISETVRATGGRGTVHWMAPEVIEHSAYGLSADVYSYGVCMWELAARRVPYEHMDDMMEIAKAVLLRKERPPLPPYLPPTVSKLIRVCWADQSQDRPTLAQIIEFLMRPDFLPDNVRHQPVPFPVLPQ